MYEEQISYRQELDLLENLKNVLKYTSDTPLDEMIFDECASWPSDHYAERRVQWIMAGYPDLNDEYEEDVTLYLSTDTKRSIITTLHALIGVALADLARQYTHTVIDIDEDTPETALINVRTAIADHRDTLGLTGIDQHALSAPYGYAVMYTNQHRHDVVVSQLN